MPTPQPTVGAVVLSQGTRMVELVRCLDGLRAQKGIDLDILVVGNGWEPTGIGDGLRTLALPENLGIPEGRNVGAAQVRGDLVCFIDDDAWIDDPLLLSRMADEFARRPHTATIQPHMCDENGVTMRRWVPRVLTNNPSRPGPGFTIAECMFVVRRVAFDEAGGWPGHFFYGHEGIDLAWRLRDHGWDVYYAGNLVAHHPATSPARHAVFYRHNARNRVWIARRNLPAPILAIYLFNWTLVTLARLIRTPAAIPTWVKGFVEGFRTDPGPRQPMSWKTVLKLTKLGHPPVL